MKIAITGGTGFVGRHLARELTQNGHSIVLIARGADTRDEAVRHLPNVTFVRIGLDSTDELATAFEGCDAIAHCAGINRNLGSQTYPRVHIDGTSHVVAAAEIAGVKKVLLLSFLRARPDCGSEYHQSKWRAEEIVRNSGLDFTVIKAGMIYGRGDHMLDHLSHTLHSLPLFATVGLREKPIRPVAVEDVVRILVASLIEGQLTRQTVAVVGPQAMRLSDAVRQVARLSGKRVLIFPFPIWGHRVLAFVFERAMNVPLISSAQVFMLSEGITQVAPLADELPAELQPQTRFEDNWVRARLPSAKGFAMEDLRC